MPNAILIDTSNLNTLFKVNDRFAMGTNYSSSLERIVIDAQALGTSFDVYLSMWPRPQGEGDDIINALSIGGVPFVVLREEVEQVLNLMKDIPGVGTIYLCNALANFVSQSRVSNFKSVINYGDRIALISVANKMLEDLTVYDGPSALQEEMGEDFTCYGDLDLIDVDAIRAQYSEFTNTPKPLLVPLSHLITSYRSAFNVEAEVVKKELGLGEYADQRPQEAPPPPKPKPVRKAPPKPIEEHNEPVDYRPKRKARISIINALLVLMVFVGSAVCGLGFAFENKLPEISRLPSESDTLRAETAKYNQLSSIYQNSTGLAGKASDLLSYALVNTNSFTITGLELQANAVTIRCNTVDQTGMDGFKAYLEQGGYVVGDINSLENTVGANNTVVYVYNVEVVLP